MHGQFASGLEDDIKFSDDAELHVFELGEWATEDGFSRAWARLAVAHVVLSADDMGQGCYWKNSTVS